MNKDYNNFVARMGSFEDTLDLTDDELKHYGVLGMKWGRRSSSPNTIKPSHMKAMTPGTINAVAKTGQSAANFGQAINKSRFTSKAVKQAKSMSDDDLKQIVSRMELENRYLNAATQQAGRGKVDSILSTAGSALAVASSAAVMFEALKKVKG